MQRRGGRDATRSPGAGGQSVGSEDGTNAGSQGAPAGLPQPPEIVFSGGGGEWQDVLRDRFVDLCFGAFVLFLIIMYAYQRFDFQPIIGQETLDQHPTVKKIVAMVLALILGSVTRACGGKASQYFDATIGMAFGLMAWARDVTKPPTAGAAPHAGGGQRTASKEQ